MLSSHQWYILGTITEQNITEQNFILHRLHYIITCVLTVRKSIYITGFDNGLVKDNGSLIIFGRFGDGDDSFLIVSVRTLQFQTRPLLQYLLSESAEYVWLFQKYIHILQIVQTEVENTNKYYR